MMDPRSRYHLSDGMVNYILLNYYGRDKITEKNGNLKRCAIYFPQLVNYIPAHSEQDVEVSDDDASTWEFQAPLPSRSRRPSSSISDVSSTTPAQDIINRYRAGQPLNFLTADSIAKLEASSESSDDGESSSAPETWETCPNDESTEPVVGETSQELEVPEVSAVGCLSPRTIQCHSVLELLHDAREEAYKIMEELEQKEHEAIMCCKPGCSDTLKDVNAFVYHLHIHNIEARTRSYECRRCHGRYDTRRELAMHLCIRERLKSLPSSPIGGEQFPSSPQQNLAPELI